MALSVTRSVSVCIPAVMLLQNNTYTWLWLLWSHVASALRVTSDATDAFLLLPACTMDTCLDRLFDAISGHLQQAKRFSDQTCKCINFICCLFVLIYSTLLVVLHGYYWVLNLILHGMNVATVAIGTRVSSLTWLLSLSELVFRRWRDYCRCRSSCIFVDVATPWRHFPSVYLAA